MDMKTLGTTIPVLDKGYVRLTRAMVEPDAEGNVRLCDDLASVNDARVSYMKNSSEWTTRAQKEKGSDEGLHQFLLEAKPVPHLAPFRGQVIQVEVKAPLMVAREWFKHRIGCVHGSDSAELLGVPRPELVELWLSHGDDEGFSDLMFARNEVSRRYVTIDPEFYLPAADEWRGKPKNSKQGSGAFLSEEEGGMWTYHLEESQKEGLKMFEAAVEAGIAAEQARLFLNAYGLYTIWRWTCSLQAACHFLTQRMDGAAQKEIRCYANAFARLVQPLFPYTLEKVISPKVSFFADVTSRPIDFPEKTKTLHT